METIQTQRPLGRSTITPARRARKLLGALAKNVSPRFSYAHIPLGCRAPVPAAGFSLSRPSVSPRIHPRHAIMPAQAVVIQHHPHQA